MFAKIPVPDPVRRRFNSLARENFALWMFIAQNDLYEEAEEFLSDETCDKIFLRCLLVEEDAFTYPSPEEDDSYPF